MTVGVAVVGTGFGVLTHVRALRAAGLDVVALVGRDPDKTQARAERADVPHADTDLDAVLARAEVDAVTIATPPHTHAPIAIAAVEARKHVICEKPFARDAAEAEQMRAAADAAGVVHLLGTEFRWDTGQALLQRVVRDGAIGDPRMALFLLHIPLLADPTAEVPAWWSDRSAGGGWLGAHASHVIDQVRGLFGELDGVSASLPVPTERGWTAEDSYTVHFRTHSGVEGVLQATAADRGPITIMNRIVGSAGSAWAEGPNVFVADDAGTRQLDIPDDLVLADPVPPDADLMVTAYDLLHSTGLDLAPYTRLCETFRALIEGEPVSDDPAPATFADGVALMRILDAIRRADTDRTWVSCA